MVYFPDTTEDPSFNMIAADSTKICRGHELAAEKFVAFEGKNIGRRFYTCQLKNVSSDFCQYKFFRVVKLF